MGSDPITAFNLRGLPDAPGFSLLELMPIPRNAAQAAAGIARWKRDQGVLQSTKDIVLEAIMNHQIPATGTERSITAEALRQEGRREGILNLARRLVDPEALRDLETLGNLDELERRVLALIETR